MNFPAILYGVVVLAQALGHMTSADEQWDKFKSTYRKVYEGTEDAYRRQIWKANVEYINQHNSEADKGHHSYRLGVNAFADLTRRERDILLQKTKPKHHLDRTYCTGKPDFRHGKMPESFDWRTFGFVTNVKNQGMCGSPWAFSVLGAIESRNAIYCPPHQAVSLSAQNLLDCSGKYGNQGCNGGLMDPTYGYIMDNGGVDTDTSYPYEAKEGQCRFNPGTIGADIRGCVDLPPGNETALQIIVFTNGPVAVGLFAALPSFEFYKSGVFDDPECRTDQIDHAALVVGYGVMNGKKYWAVKNSWGVNWGMQGYILIARDHGNLCGITNLASYPEMLCDF